MSGLARRVVAMLGARFTAPLGSWRDQVAELEQRHGSVRAAAAAAGIPRRTWRYWSERIAAGKEPRPKQGTLDRLADAVRAGRYSDVTPDAQVVIEATDRNDTSRTRRLTAERLRLAEGTMQRVARTYAATGNAETAAAEFLKGVRDQWYRGYLTPRRDQIGDDDDGDQGDDDHGYGDDQDAGVSDEYDEDYDVYYDDEYAADAYGPDYEDYGADVAA